MHKKNILGSMTALFAFVLILIIGVVTGCTTPTYQKSVTYSYDSKGNLLGHTVTEAIVQPAPSTSPMKVKITHRDELEGR
jgi:YD repeat-containing protein